MLDDLGYPGRLGWSAKTWRLKTIQDCVALHEIEQQDFSVIAEIGGGRSRILPLLVQQGRHCINIDDFQGAGQGPTKEVNLPGVTNILTKLGQFNPLISDNSIDFAFSVSVLEHVPDPDIPLFFQDTARILRSRGMVLHLFDAYIHSEVKRNSRIVARIRSYRDAMSMSGLQFRDPNRVLEGENISFHSSYATNSDHVMANWNRLVPELKKTRCEYQSCTLLMACIKPFPEVDRL